MTKQPTTRQAPASQKSAPASTADSLSGAFAAIEVGLGKRKNLLLIVATVLSALFSFLLFDGRLSFATDDATYIQNAISLLKTGGYPNYQGALYPMALSVLISMFGVKLLLLKVFSALCIIAHVYILGKALLNRIPHLITFAIVFTSALNPYILSYGSFTFNEAFFLLIQALCFFSFTRLLDRLAENNSLKENLGLWLAVGFTFFLLSITKNLAVLGIGVVIFFFLAEKRFREAIISLGVFLLFRLPYEVLIRGIFNGVQSSQQVDQILQKDYNNADLGQAGLGDFIERLTTNFGQYFSTHTLKILGVRQGGVPDLYTFDKQAEMQVQWTGTAFLP